MAGKLRTLGVIPVRLTSTRVQEKALQVIAGRTLLEWVWRAAESVSDLDRLVVATDSTQVAQVVSDFGGDVEVTSGLFKNGSERCWAVASHSDAEIIVNIQGDQPQLDPQAVSAIVRVLQQGDVPVASPMVPLEGAEFGSSVVRVTTDDNGDALHFSRNDIVGEGPNYRHVGIYGYRRNTLKKYCSWPQTDLELSEGLEQLRLLEYGVDIRMVLLDSASIPVDTLEDLARVRGVLSGNQES